MSCSCSSPSSNVQSCCTTSGSTCCNTNPNCCCTPLGGISNIDQGFFQNSPTKKITNVPSVDLAYFTNCENNNDIDNTVVLNPTYLTWGDFVSLFFSNNAASFSISSSNANNSAISFYGQTYETTQNKKQPFSVAQQIIKAWSKKNSKPENSVPIPYKIQLERSSFLTKSLLSITCFQMSMNLDEAISALLSQNEIEVGDSDTSAMVNFTISYRNYFCPLDTSALIVFTFITSIPGYKNVSENIYSNDTTKPRKVFQYEDDTMSYTSETSSATPSVAKSSFSISGNENKTYFTTFDMNNSVDNDSVTIGEDIEKILYSNKCDNGSNCNEEWR